MGDFDFSSRDDRIFKVGRPLLESSPASVGGSGTRQAHWERYLVQAIEDAGLRQSVALAARTEVEQRFDPALTSAKMARLLNDVVDDVKKKS